MKHTEFKLKTFDGLSLFGQNWQPENHPKAVIYLVHGMGEHSGRYVHVADRLTKAGYIIFAFDLRGHLVLNYVLRRKPELKGAVTTGPWLRLAFEPPAFKVILAKVTNQIWPSFSQISGLDTKAISRDPEVVRAYENDPLGHDHISARMFIGVYQAGQWSLEHASELPIPLLLMHGGDDKLSSVKASREFADKVTEKCTLKILDGLYHEIHSEPEKEEVFKFLIDWLDKKVSE